MPRHQVSFALILLLGSSLPLAAQALACEQPKDCTLATAAPREVLVFKLSGPDHSSRWLILASTAGKTQDSVQTDANGVARALWTSDGATGATIHVLLAGPENLRQSVILGAATRPTIHAILPDDRWYNVRGFISNKPQWYEGRQLKVRPAVRIENAGVCEGTAVRFASYAKDSEAKPETTYARTVTRGGQARCEAETNLLLGKGSAENELRATLLNDPSQRASYIAKSRALPWVGIGLAATSATQFVGTSTRERTIRVTRRSQVGVGGDSLEVAYDSVAKSSRPDSIKAGRTIAPVIGVNFPLILRLEWLRVYVGADLQNPRSSWYGGLSLSQIFAGWQHESVGYDVAFVTHVSRRDVVTNPACASAIDTCEVQAQTGRVGYGLLVSLSTEGVFQKLVTALGVK